MYSIPQKDINYKNNDMMCIDIGNDLGHFPTRTPLASIVYFSRIKGLATPFSILTVNGSWSVYVLVDDIAPLKIARGKIHKTKPRKKLAEKFERRHVYTPTYRLKRRLVYTPTYRLRV